MKKASLCICLIVLMIYPIISYAQNSDFGLYYYNSQKLRKSEQYTNYYLSPYKNWQLQVNGKTHEDNRLDFNQRSVNNNLSLLLTNNNSYLKHSITSGYDYYYDHSSLESELNPYRNKTGFLGYGLQFNPIDSLLISTHSTAYYRQEQDRYKLQHEFISKGLLERCNAQYTISNQNNNFLVSGIWENKHLDWEAYQQLSARLSANLERHSTLINTYVNASIRNEDLYVLVIKESADSALFSDYDRYDRQYRQNLDTNINLYTQLDDSFEIQLSEQYSISAYSHKYNKTRNSGDFNNLAQIKASYQLTDNVYLKSENSHTYYIKDLSYVQNSRIIDVRYSNNSINWEYNPYDSLSVDYSLELRRTDYPDSDHKLDNDYLNKILKLNWTVFWKDRFRINNRIIYSTKEEVFIDAWLSANNNIVKGLQWQPACYILIGDCFLLQQEYQIKADYDDYYYDTFTDINDTFYRHVAASYHLIYDSTPLVSKLTMPKWTFLPFRSRNPEAFRFDLRYSWERNETSSKEGNTYYINGEINRQIVSCVVQKQYDFGIYQIMPKYTWGTWKEYSLLLSGLWQLNKNSIAEINFNPLGETISDLDWRISCSINLQF